MNLFVPFLLFHSADGSIADPYMIGIAGKVYRIASILSEKKKLLTLYNKQKVAVQVVKPV